MEPVSDYLAYQSKYRDTPRSSDVELIRLISKRTPKGGRVLDVGCSTGNLLRHLQAARPDLSLRGCDVDTDALAECPNQFLVFRANIAERLPTGILATTPPTTVLTFDSTVLNAVLYCLTDEQTAAALGNIHAILKPGGHLFVWDLLHRWNQRLTIREESTRYGDVTYHIRSYTLFEQLAKDAGFGNVKFLPCKTPRLDRPDDPDDLTSWTFPQGWNKGAVPFRGGVAQPWCYAVLTK